MKYNGKELGRNLIRTGNESRKEYIEGTGKGFLEEPEEETEKEPKPRKVLIEKTEKESMKLGIEYEGTGKGILK